MKEYIIAFEGGATWSGYRAEDHIPQQRLVGELIRCKDCKYYGQNGYRYGCIHAVPIMMPNNYCSNAERKEE